MSLPKTYNPKETEDKLYKRWESSGYFNPDHLPKTKDAPRKEPFTIAMPPPNATGTLHLGHAARMTVEDLIIRYQRMRGKKTLWIPGTDHAAIATQNKVEKLIAKDGLTRQDLGREKFLQRVREYVKESRETIRTQIRKMGSSCDWSRERYTLDEGLSRAVSIVFEKMFHDGLIYRGYRIVNWCPRCASTLANDEVVYQPTKGKLYTIIYGPLKLATARPETKFGDTAVAVHPDDPRYQQLIGKMIEIETVIGPATIKVIADKAVDQKFGTGVIKVTPAHDFTDFEIGKRHNLEIRQVITEEGRLNHHAGKYEGLIAWKARNQIVADMEKKGLIEKTEDYENNLSVCYRCETSIEPLISLQWFIDVNKKVTSRNKSLKQLSTEVVRKKEIKIFPDRFEKTYFQWMDNLHDWCISRQIWWGHRIPVWYCESCKPATQEKITYKMSSFQEGAIVSSQPPKKCPTCGSKNLTQDPDTLDTWFSSGLWTFSTLGWPRKTKDLKNFHPTQVLETGYDIIFFWVARMIIMTTYTLKQVPFEKVYLSGMIRDKQGRKMSKSLGNGIDPLEMIEKYGTDALRLSLVLGVSAGQDSRLYEEKIAGYRNFTNKLWNVGRYIITRNSSSSEKSTSSSSKSIADAWIMSKLHRLIHEVTKDFESYEFGHGGEKLYNFLWHDCADWYIEVSKKRNDPKAQKVLSEILETFLKLAHPFIPFVTEELWSQLYPKDMLMISPWPKAKKSLINPSIEKQFEKIRETIISIRNLRAERRIAPEKYIPFLSHSKKLSAEEISVIEQLARLQFSSKKIAGKTIEVPVAHYKLSLIIPESAVSKGQQEKFHKEIENLKHHISTLEKKLGHKGFLQKAPKAVIEGEKQKLKEWKEKLKTMEKE